jgi:hypothetical protein
MWELTIFRFTVSSTGSNLHCLFAFGDLPKRCKLLQTLPAPLSMHRLPCQCLLLRARPSPSESFHSEVQVVQVLALSDVTGAFVAHVMRCTLQKLGPHIWSWDSWGGFVATNGSLAAANCGSGEKWIVVDEYLILWKPEVWIRVIVHVFRANEVNGALPFLPRLQIGQCRHSPNPVLQSKAKKCAGGSGHGIMIFDSCKALLSCDWRLLQLLLHRFFNLCRAHA